LYERAFAGVVASWIRFGVITLVGLLQTPILFRHLPLPELGVWFLFFTIATFINLSDLGLPSVFGRSVSYIWGRGQAEVVEPPQAGAPYYHNVPVHDLYRSALVATLIVGAAVSLAGYPLARNYLSSISDDPLVLEKLAWALACFLAGVVLNLTAAIPNACLSGYGDVGWDNAVRTAANLFGFVLLLWLLPIYKDIRVLSLIYLAQGAFAFLAGHFALSRLHRVSIRAGGRVRFSAVAGMYREAAPMFVTRLGIWMIAESTLLLAGYFLGPAKVPDFAILRQIVTMGMTVATAIPIALAPYAAAAHAAMDPAKANLIYRKSLRYTMVLTVLWTVGLLLWTPKVMDLWVGEGHFLGYGVLVPVVVACFMELHAAAHGFFVWSAGKWPFAPVAVLAGVLNVLLAGFGCSRFGYEGLVWGSLLSQAMSSHWYGVYYALKLLGLPASRYFREIVRPTALYMGLLMAAAVMVKYSLDWGMHLLGFPVSSGWFLIGLVLSGVLLTSIIAVGFAWGLVLENDDRADVLRLLKWRG
jgi:O-antigen/teichoic acid export membrane protein